MSQSSHFRNRRIIRRLEFHLTTQIAYAIGECEEMIARAMQSIPILFAVCNCVCAQTSELYVNQIEHNQMVVVQGGAVARTWNLQTRGENALAVADTVRTAGNLWNNRNATGGEYGLDGTLISYDYSILPEGNWFDGTTDGILFNYAIQHNQDYMLYQFDREWSNALPLFSVGFPASGIAFDRLTSTFWICDSLSARVRNVDMSGVTHSSFFADVPFGTYGLAFDPADRTLWIGGYGSSSIYQLDLAGNNLSSVNIPGFNSAYGMEFAVVPEPSAALLLGLGIAVMPLRRRCLLRTDA